MNSGYTRTTLSSCTSAPQITWATALMLVLCGLLLGMPEAQARYSGCAQDRSVFRISDGFSGESINDCFYWYEDKEAHLGINELRAEEDKLSFTEATGGVVNLGYTDSAMWARFKFLYQGRLEQSEQILELNLPLADDVSLYVFNSRGMIEESHAGYDTPWHERDLAVPNPTFRLELPKGEEVTVYLRVKSETTIRLPVTLWSSAHLAEKIALDEWIYGFFVGGIITILLYNFFVYLSARDISYLYYVLFLVFILLFKLSEQVHGQQIFSAPPAILKKSLMPYYIVISWFWALLLAKNFLDTKKHAPLLNFVLSHGVAFSVITFIMFFFVTFSQAVQWVVILSLLLALIMSSVTWVAWRRNTPAARFYFLAWSFLFVGVLIYAGSVSGYLPVNAVTTNAVPLGVLLQAVLISFALADRIKNVQRNALEWNQRAVVNLQRYRSLFDNAIEGIFRMSLSARLIDANRAMAEILGYNTVQQLLKRTGDALQQLFDDPAKRAEAIYELTTRGELQSMESVYSTASGEKRWGTISLRAVYDARGKPTHVEGTFIDITERKQREQILKEREAERVEKELANSSAAAKSQFLANMSHEIRTPLTAIIGYGESLLDPSFDEEQKRDAAETVVRSGRHLLELVNDILDHSKIDANRLEVEILPLYLPEMIHDIRSYFEPRAREKGLEFSVNCEFPIPETIATDPTRLRQILINLCGNALKFTERGSVQVHIRCDREQEKLIARVIDSGIGLRPEQMERLFDPFAQGSAAIARQYGGTGLGLSISRRLAELLGGEVTVASTYGRGSEFEVSVATGPLKKTQFLRDISELNLRRQQITLAGAPKLKGRLLYAEDNEVNRRLVDMLVSKTGASIIHVGNGAEALEIVSRQHFDLILMDIQMPVMNGRDATKAIREAGNRTPIVALTANVMSEDVSDYREAGCTDVLAKPIEKYKFFEMLARYLEPDREDTPRFEGTVLVAEDNRDNFGLIERMLKRYGVEVIHAETGKQAVQLALSKTVSMILMDSHMPEMEGPEATQMLRTTGFRRPIVAFTAGEQDEAEALMRAGCDGMLAKPIDDQKLRDVLKKHLPPVSDKAKDNGDTLDISDLAREFVAGLPAREQEMLNAFKQQDWDTLKKQAHQIKGTAGSMGYPDMTSAAAALDSALKHGAHEEVGALLDTVTEMIHAACDDKNEKTVI